MRKEINLGPHKCPVCHKFEFAGRYSYDFCPWCGWCDDSRDDTDDEWSGYNRDTIGDYREKYEAGKMETPELLEYREMMRKDGELYGIKPVNLLEQKVADMP